MYCESLKDEEKRDSALMRVDGADKAMVKQISMETGLTQRSVIHSLLGVLDFASDYGYAELISSSFSPEVRLKVKSYIENRGRPKEVQRQFEREENVRRLVAYKDTLLAEVTRVDALIQKELK